MMKLIELAQLKTASLLALLSVIGSLSFSPICLSAAEKAKETPVTIRLDFIVGGNHAPWFVAWAKGFYAKRGLNVTIQPGTGSADTIRTIAAGGADVGFANVSTAGACQDQQLRLQVDQDRGDRTASSAGGFAGQESRLHHHVPRLER